MPKGIFTQGVVVLTSRTIPIDEVAAALSGFNQRGVREASEQWALGGASLQVVFDEALNGMVTIDTVEHPWPDHMGDPKDEAILFGAWAMGNFGPYAYPGGLFRASQQSWNWEGGQNVADQHTAFLRLRVSYVLGAADDAAVMPDGCNPLAELEFCMKLVQALLEIPGTLCYFNPSGEVLRDQDTFRESLNFAWANQLLPLDLWSNVRLFNVNETWSMMDSVGNWQLDLPDCEACFLGEAYDFNEVDNFLRNVTLYLIEQGEVIEDGDTMDGPGDIPWQAKLQENSLCEPPRIVLRWLPLDDHEVPEEIVNANDADDENEDEEQPE
ncbi:DUF4261 domain-containing protein [Blastopirellula marina]|nr:DUF4261 domain-containing protein [Blastopirellula marina]